MDVFTKVAGLKSVTSLIGVMLFFIMLLPDSSVEGALSLTQSSTVMPHIIHLKVVNACKTSATLQWAVEGDNLEPETQICELTYYPSGRPGAQIIDIFLESHSNIIKLFNLSQEENYAAFMACDSSGKTNEVTFTVGTQCEMSGMSNASLVTSDSDKPVVSSYTHSTSFSAVEWPIAVTFAAAGVIICVIVAFYMWKKYQRRQRILRIFRQGQNDPFQALYSPTQDSYSF